jgi:hypothetical protein
MMQFAGFIAALNCATVRECPVDEGYVRRKAAVFGVVIVETFFCVIVFLSYSIIFLTYLLHGAESFLRI